MIGLAEHSAVSVMSQSDRESRDPPPRLEEPLQAGEVQRVGCCGHGGAPLLVEALHVLHHQCPPNDSRLGFEQAWFLGSGPGLRVSGHRLRADSPASGDSTTTRVVPTSWTMGPWIS